MNKWIMCVAAMISFNLVAAPSKQETAAIAEFNNTIKAELKQAITSQSAKKAAIKKIKLDVQVANQRQAETPKLIAQVDYAEHQAD